MAVFIILIFLIKKVLTDVNVAFGKEVTDCNGNQLDQQMVDGDKTTKSELIEVCCGSDCSVNINLGADYYIHYVVVYDGISNKSFDTLNEFVVIIKPSASPMYICSIYSKINTGFLYLDGMRMNCKFGKGEIVSVKTNHPQSFFISEIEVYTMSAGEPDQDVTIHHGCFQNLTNIISIPSIGNLENCTNECRKSHFPLAALLAEEKCFCGKSPLRRLPLMQCDKICGNHICGGDTVYSVYLVHLQLPYYIGCYVDSSTSFSSANMTIIFCMKYCLNGYKYVMLKNGQVCICRNQNIYNTTTISHECNVSCSGDDDRICGGNHSVSLYSVTSELMDIQILKLMRCLNNYDEYGLCMGGCEMHYLGDHCLEAYVRYCIDINPCTHLANRECVTIGSTYKCKCRKGFTSEVFSKHCHDIDECLKDPCNSTTTECHNTEGSYSCICKAGYISSKTYGCSQSDVFCSSLNPCKYIPNSQCIVSGSIYKCQCDEGYIKSYGICIVDVCQVEKPCSGLPNSACISIGTHFKCRCLPGYMLSYQLCKDINECLREPCDLSISACINLNGSYYCKCNPSLIQLTEYVCIRNISMFEANYFEPLKVFIYFFILPFIIISIIFSFFWFISNAMKTSSITFPFSLPETPT